MNIEALAARVVAVVALIQLGRQVSTARLLEGADLDRARKAYLWLVENLKDRAKEALNDLERDPSSEDNKADLRKQLTRVLEKEPASAALLGEMIPDSFNVESGSSVATRVGAALNIASGAIGIFGAGRIRE